MKRNCRHLLFLLFLLSALVAAPFRSAQAAPGDLDLDFGTGGLVITSIGDYNDTGSAVAIQSDGKILVVGYSNTPYGNAIALVRYNTDGNLDNSFGTNGKVAIPFGSSSAIGNAVAIQSDGKIVVAGDTFHAFALARYNSNGSLDTTFDTDGLVSTPFGSSEDYGQAIAIQSDGKIVVAGKTGVGIGSVFALARYNSNGSLDTTFDTDGKVTTHIGIGYNIANAVAIQSDGKIVAAGDAYNGTISPADFALARYNTNGSLDTTFGTDGKVTTNIFGYDYCHAVAIQSDGKIVLAGHSDSPNNVGAAFSLARYNTNGSLDTTFGTDGKVTTSIGSISSVGNAVAIQHGGKIVVVGTSYDSSNSDFALARYNINGSLDTTFGTDGLVTTPFGSGDVRGNAVAIQSDNKIVVAGEYNLNDGYYDFALARYEAEPPPTPTPIYLPLVVR